MPFVTGKSPQITENSAPYHGSSMKERAKTTLVGEEVDTETPPAFPPLPKNTWLVTQGSMWRENGALYKKELPDKEKYIFIK